MSLEGPRPDRLAQLRGELYASVPRQWWRAAAELNGIMDPYRTNWPLAIGALLFGAWLAGSRRGRRIIASARRRRR